MQRVLTCSTLLSLILIWGTFPCATQIRCSFAGGTFTPPGSCAGPSGRAAARIASVSEHNYGCSLNEVPYALNGSLKCGQCSPSWHGAMRFTAVPIWQCDTDEYCNSGGRCAKFKYSPHEGRPCNSDSDALACPLGLTCIHHKCRVCNRLLPYRSNRASLEAAVCISNRLDAQASHPFMQPETSLSVIIFCLAAVALLVLACVANDKDKRPRTGLLQLVDEEDEDRDEEEIR